jgi:uncharacterized protein (UPF0276 family)
MKAIHRNPETAGIGLRLAHSAEMVATRPSTGWLEIHPENFLSNPHAAELLSELSARYAISLHTVGISIGTVSGIDRSHLKRIRRLVDGINPILISGHLAWSMYGNEYLNDLLPLPYNEESLSLVAVHIAEIQDSLGRPYLIENPASYVGFSSSTIHEIEFLAEIVRRTGCKLLCDISNIVVTAHNMGYDAHEYIDQCPSDAIAEIHLGGFTPEEDPATPGAELWIDTHASPIAAQSWDLYAYAVRRFGWKPTLIEWDNNIPSLTTLLGQAASADGIARANQSKVPYANAR